MASTKEEQQKKARALYVSVAERAQQIRLRDGQKRSDKVMNKLSEESLFFDELENRLSEALKGWKRPSVAKTPSKKSDPFANLLLTDLHFGSMLGSEVIFPYGALEESRRMASVVQQTIDAYGKQTNKLNLYLLGDIIQNQLHDARDGAPLAAQACAAISILSQAISGLETVFDNEINVYCSTGNHGRFTSRHHGRAVHQKWDSLEQVVYYSLSKMFEGSKVVKFHLNKSHYIQHSVAGHSIFATHGDTVMNVGSPNKSINVRGVESILARLKGNFDHSVKVFLCGHTHSPMVLPMSNGTYLIMNGALVPSDEFASTQGWLTTATGQWGWLTNEKRAAYDFRLHEVGPEQDKDAELNRIIKPYEY